MNKLILLISMVITIFVGYKYYAGYQQELQIKKAKQQAAIKQQLEQKEFDLALSQNDISALKKFIHDYPQSTNREKALFELNRLAYQKAMKSENVQILKQYINNHPDSNNLDEARKKLNSVMLQQAEKDFTQKQIQARERYKQQQQQKKQASVSTEKERVNRALSIYQKLRQKEERKTYQSKMEQQRQQEFSSKCNQIKDQLRQFKRNTRWYNLDEKGNRVFMDKQQVASMKTDMQKTYNENCQ